MAVNITEKDGAATFFVRVVPRASKSEIVGEFDGTLKVRVASPPVDGAANAELIKLLARQFCVSRSDVEILKGQTSKTKQIRITGLTIHEINAILKAKS
jgi:uncharacterized protein (TIGR00251 family)